MKKLLLIPLILIPLSGNCQDLQTGTTFVDGGSVTAASLNNATNNAVIQPAFVSGKSAITPLSSDSVLAYQASSATLKRITVGAFSTLAWTSPTFTGTTDITQNFNISGTLTPTAIAADQNDYNPSGLGTASTLRLATDASANKNITGLMGGTNGRIIILHNIDATYNFTLKAAGAAGGTATGSLAANRFGWVNDYILHPGEVVMLQYGGTSNLWRRLSKQAIDDITIAPTFGALTYGATTTETMDATKAFQNATLTLTGNTQLAFSGLVAGMSGELRVTQDATGSRKLSLPGPTFTDIITVTASTGVTSLTATFAAADVGKPINQSGNANIAVGTTIASIQATTITAGSNAAVLPQATINVASTTGFTLAGPINVTTGGGVQSVTCTGGTGTTFTGCTGGSGTMSTGGAVGQTVMSAAATLGAASITAYLPGRQSKVTGGGNGAVALTATANALDVMAWSYDGTNLVWTVGKNAN